MKKQLNVIYVTGLGDARATGQKRAVALWRWYGVKPHFFQMKWADGEAWEQKFERLLALIDTLRNEGRDVALVGISAGAGVVINAFAARKTEVVGVVLIAGKVNHPNAIGSSFSSKNPAFLPSAEAAPLSLEQLAATERVRILSRYGLVDELVATRDSIIPGAHNQRVPTMGHFITIAMQITFGAPSLLRFLKKQR